MDTRRAPTRRKKNRANPFGLILLVALVIIAAAGLILFAAGYRYINTDGVKFNGFVKNGLPHHGTVKYADDLSGKLLVDDETGICTITYSNGDVYTGGLNGIMRHGFGSITIKETDEVYTGDFVNDKLTGTATVTAPNGAKYEGEMVDGKKNGIGKFTFSDGSYYYGEFKDDMRNGNGEQHNADGSSYYGSFVGDKRQGTSVVTFTLMDGSTFNGKPRMVFANGDEYVGDYFNDKRTGNGKYIWSTGAVYEGDFAGGVPHGIGTYTAKQGSTPYTGEFADGQPVVPEQPTVSVPETNTNVPMANVPVTNG